jgi:hypothetical protein
MNLIHNQIGKIPEGLLAKVQWNFAIGESLIGENLIGESRKILQNIIESIINTSLLALPVEIVHRIFDYCDVKTSGVTSI